MVIPPFPPGSSPAFPGRTRGGPRVWGGDPLRGPSAVRGRCFHVPVRGGERVVLEVRAASCRGQARRCRGCGDGERSRLHLLFSKIQQEDTAAAAFKILDVQIGCTIVLKWGLDTFWCT